VFPVSQRGDGGDCAAGLAGKGDQVLEVSAAVADVAGQGHQVRPLARELREGRPGGAVDAAVEMHVGDTGDPEAVELVREAGDGNVVPRDIDRDGLDEKPVAQRGGGDGAGGSDEELATGEGHRHGGKPNGSREQGAGSSRATNSCSLLPAPCSFLAVKPLNPVRTALSLGGAERGG